MNQAIIIIGGYNSLWPLYLKMARDLEDLTSLQAVAVPLMPWHWWASRRRADATELLQKLDETVTWARRRFQADRFILVGHSAGGLLARLYLYEGPVWGHTYCGVEHVSTVCTLGSPHCSESGKNLGWFLSDEANRLVPGTPFAAGTSCAAGIGHAGKVHYHAVAGRYIQGHQKGSLKERRAFQFYRFFAGQGDAWGDGLVPVQCARLDGAKTTVMEGVAHSRKLGRDWYGGSKAIIRGWWPRGDANAQ